MSIRTFKGLTSIVAVSAMLIQNPAVFISAGAASEYTEEKYAWLDLEREDIMDRISNNETLNKFAAYKMAAQGGDIELITDNGEKALKMSGRAFAQFRALDISEQDFYVDYSFKYNYDYDKIGFTDMKDLFCVVNDTYNSFILRWQDSSVLRNIIVDGSHYIRSNAKYATENIVNKWQSFRTVYDYNEEDKKYYEKTYILEDGQYKSFGNAPITFNGTTKIQYITINANRDFYEEHSSADDINLMLKGVKLVKVSDASKIKMNDSSTASLAVNKIKSDDGIISVELTDIPTADEAAAFPKTARIVCEDSNNSVDASVKYVDGTNKLNLCFPALEPLMYVQNGGVYKMLPAEYSVDIKGIKVAGTFSLSDSPSMYLNVSGASAEGKASDYSPGFRPGGTSKGFKFVEKTDEARRYITSSDTAAKYLSAIDVASSLNGEFYLDFSVNCADGNFKLSMANAKDVLGADAKWPPIIIGENGIYNSDNSVPLNSGYYTAPDGFTDFRVVLSKRQNGGYLRTIYNKQQDGNYIKLQGPEYWNGSNGSNVASDMSCLTYAIKDGRETNAGTKVAKLNIYTQKADTVVPDAEIVYENQDVVINFNVGINENTLTSDNVLVYEGNEAVNKNYSYDRMAKKLTIYDAADFTKIVLKNIYALNGLPLDETSFKNAENKIVFTDENGNELSYLPENGNVMTSARIRNYSQNDGKFSLYLAQFDKSGKLLEVAAKAEQTVESGKTADVSADMANDELIVDSSLHAFLWNGMNPAGYKATISKNAVEAIKNNTLISDRVNKKTAEGKKFNVVYIGGSITQGTGAASGESWVDILSKTFTDAFSAEKTANYNAGYGGTGSDYGVARLGTDVIDKDPDLVFVEWAVNDRYKNQAEVKKYVEGIVRQLNSLDNPPMICFVYTTMFLDTTELSQKTYSEIAEYYNIPEIDLRDYLWNDYFEGKPVTESEMKTVLGDGTHPNAAGYKLYADYILKNITRDNFLKYPLQKEQPLCKDYIKTTGKLLTAQMILDGIESGEIKNNGWDVSNSNGGVILSSSHKGDTISFKFSGNILLLASQLGSNNGKYTVEIDGEPYDGDCYGGGIEGPSFEKFDLTDGEHTVSITNKEDKYVNFKKIYVAR